MSIIFYSVILRGRASIYFSFLSTYIAKEEGILPCGVFGVASALITPLSNWIFPSSIFFSETFGLCFWGNFLFIIIVYLLFIVCSNQNLYFAVKSYLRYFSASIVARETACYPNEPKWTCALRLSIVRFLSFLSF